MLDLDSPQWAELRTAYGTASDVPGMLEELYAGRTEALDDLFGYLCHQGSIYTASAAALPHLLHIAQTVKVADAPEFQVDVLSLAGAICESPEFTPDLYTPYLKKSFFEQAQAQALGALAEFENSSCALYLIKAAAAFAGFAALARVLDGFANEEFLSVCPQCEAELYIWPAHPGLSVAAQDPVVFPDTDRLPVQASTPDQSRQEAGYHWLVQVLARQPGLADFRQAVEALFGTATCPACHHDFALIDALVENAE